MGEVFKNLESNDLHTVEEAKIELTKTFSQTKEPWLVSGLMEYFIQQKSVRIVDVLVKVQAPHDTHIFDKLVEWTNSSKRSHVFELFWHIVKRHPSWLYKVASHAFFREILRVLKTESNIITTMSALFCLLILLPIIPTQMPQYLQELFEVFMYMATWKTRNVPELTGNQMIHLQMGILKLFQQLYGMYPCNFIAYLRNNTKENQIIFTTTINPLLETVRMHPMLLVSNKDNEKQNSRWKEMEPHDVVVECSKFSLDADDRPPTIDSDSRLGENRNNSNYYTMETSSTAEHKNPLSPFKTNQSLHAIMADDSRFRGVTQQKLDTIWTPSSAILATPPPINTVNNTPTPTPIMLPAMSVMYQPSGASPPEAAVEATPETTPLKDYIKPTRVFPTSSSAARTIWGNSSQPSSPLKKDDSTFRYSESPATTHLRNMEQEFASYNSPKLMKLINDRNHSQQLTLEVQPNVTEHIPSRVFDIEVQPVSVQVAPVSDNGRKRPPLESSQSDPSQEDQEVTEINTRKIIQSQSDNISEVENRSTDNATQKKPRKTLAECYQKNKLESFDLYRRRAEEAHSESDDDVSNKSISKSWPGLKLKIPRGDHKSHSASTDNGNGQKDLGAIVETEICSVGTQTTEQYPEAYEHMYVEFLSEESTRKKNSSIVLSTTPMSPHNLLDQYIEMSTKKLTASDYSSRSDTDIQLLTILLEYERYRRSVYAERNRRLLGKCRDSAALKMNNDKFKNQIETLSFELQIVTRNLNKARLEQSAREQENVVERDRLRNEIQTERGKNKQLSLTIETLDRKLKDEADEKKQLTQKLEAVEAEIFDMRNLMKQWRTQADLGNQYKQELHRLQSEMALVGEIQLKCKDKLTELDSLRARNAEWEMMKRAYSNELQDARSVLDQKSAQLDATRERLSSLESQLSKKDYTFTEQKRLLKLMKEEYQEKLKATDAKYSAQKAIILRLEETIFELYKNKSAVNISNPDSDKTDNIGSLDHASPLSASLTSSDGLSASLRSITEIKNLHSIVGTSDSFGYAAQPSTSGNGVTTAMPVPVNRVSDDVSLPIPSTSHQHHQ